MKPETNLLARLRAARTSAKWGLAAAGLSIATLVYAVGVDGQNLFELDRNAVNGGAVGDDADQVYCDEIDPNRVGACSPAAANVAPSSSTELASVFVADKVNDKLDDGFTQGSKDTLDVLQWRWTLSPIGDKVDISNAFATLHKEPSGDSFLYLGLDKVANNGDAAIGFWILQNEVGLVAPNLFSAPHKNGDVLIQADLTSGGRLGRYDVYTWGPNSLLNQKVADAQGDLYLAIKSTNCGVSASDDACGVVNAGGDTAPWPYTPKSGPDGKFPANSYFEGGLNLSKLFPEGIPCLSTFLAETRQSQSETASTADFALGSFDLCSFSVAKVGPAVAKVGDTVEYRITIENTGALPITKTSIIDSKEGDLTNDPGCGATLAAGESCTISYTMVIPTNASPATNFGNSVTATYGVLEQTLVGSSDAFTDLFKPSVTLDKKANGSDGPVTINQGQTVDYSLKVTNTSTLDTPTLDCTVSDPMLLINQKVVLYPQGSVTIEKSAGVQMIPGAFVNTASVSCTPQNYPNAVQASDSVTVNVIKVDPTLTVDKVGDGFSKMGDTVTYTIVITNTTDETVPQALTLTSINDPLLGGSLIGHSGSDCPVSPATLAAGESCTIVASRVTQSGDPDPLPNTVTVTAVNAFGTTVDEADGHNVDLVKPNFTLTKDCLSGEIEPGDSANFSIKVRNTGDVPLEVDVVDNLLGINLQNVLLGNGTCVFDSNPGDGCLEIEGSVIAQDTNVSNTVNATGTLPSQYGLANVLTRTAGATCIVKPPQGDATRTLGFWKSHGSDGDLFEEPVENGYTCHVAEDHVKFPISLSKTPARPNGKVLLNCEDMFGVFWSNPSRDSNGVTRSALCKTKLHASWQMMAAILNDGLTNGAAVPLDPKTGLSAIDALRVALGGTDRANIVRLQGILGGYNESGGKVAIQDDDGATIPHADPNGARSIADYSAGDCTW